MEGDKVEKALRRKMKKRNNADLRHKKQIKWGKNFVGVRDSVLLGNLIKRMNTRRTYLLLKVKQAFR